MKSFILNKKTLNKIIFFILFFFVGVASAATTETIGSMAEHITKSGDAFIQLLGAISYIAAVYCAISGAIKFKEYSESKGQVKIKVPITYLLISALLLSLPSLIQTGTESLNVTPAGSSGTR